jgi:hypothetical protein
VARAGEGQRRGARAAAGPGALRGSCQRQEVAPAELQRRSAVAACNGRGGSRGRRKGGRQGLMCNFKNSRFPDVKKDFLTVLYPK